MVENLASLITLAIPADTDLRIDSKAVESILVGCRWQDGKLLALDFFAAVFVAEPAKRAPEQNRLCVLG